jgi:hypothetical protein
MNMMRALVNQSFLSCSKPTFWMGILAAAERYADMLARGSRGSCVGCFYGRE